MKIINKGVFKAIFNKALRKYHKENVLNKQNKLTQGEGIKIESDTISVDLPFAEESDIPEILSFLNKRDYSKEYFTIEALEDGSIFSPELLHDSNLPLPEGEFYSINGGPWLNDASAPISLNKGDTLRWKALGDVGTESTMKLTNAIGEEAPFNVYGNYLSLFYGDDFIGKELTSEMRVYTLMVATQVVDASNLILPANVVASAYRHMFLGCLMLSHAPILPAAIIAGTNCYFEMFHQCQNLQYIKCLATDPDMDSSWIYGVSPTGTFVKKRGVIFPEGAIPSGWEIIEVD